LTKVRESILLLSPNSVEFEIRKKQKFKRKQHSDTIKIKEEYL